MEAVYSLWDKIVNFWRYLWGIPDAESYLPKPFEPRERVYDIDVAELVKVIYYKKAQ